MSDTSLAQTAHSPIDKPRHTVEVTTKRGTRTRITRAVKAAVDAMVWEAMTRAQAAQAAGIKDQSLYAALAKPDVKSYYLAQCEVLRVSGRARRIHRLEQMVEQDGNKQAVVNAVRALEGMSEDDTQRGTNAPTKGLVIVLAPAAHMGHIRAIDAKPLISHEPVRDDGEVE